MISKFKRISESGDQVADTKTIWERSLYYWSKTHSSQLKNGQAYHKLRQTVVIFLLNYRQFPKLPDIAQHTFRLQHELVPSLFHPHIRLDFVELSKLGWQRQEQIPAHKDLAVWARFLLMPDDIELQELLMSDPILKKVKDQLEQLSNDPEARRLVQLREEAQRNLISSLEAARQEGAILQLRETVRRLLASGMDLKTIVDILKIPADKLEQIKDFENEV